MFLSDSEKKTSNIIPEEMIQPFLSNVQPVSEFRNQASQKAKDKHHKKVELTEEEKQRAFDIGYQEGLDKGHVKGVEKGILEVQKQYQEEIAHFSQELQQKRDEVLQVAHIWCENAEHRLADLAIVIAAKVLRKELEIQRDSVVEIAKEAISMVTKNTSVKIRINPFDRPVLEEKKQELIDASLCLDQIEIIDDPNIFGGCAIETDDAVIDARVEEMIVNVAKTLRGL